MPGTPPFQLLFETFGKLPDCHAPAVNAGGLEKLRRLLDQPIEAPGHCILLRAPRAGHGKTHLLTRLQHDLGGTHEFIPVHACGGREITPASVLDDTLRRLVRSLPAAGGLTVLDLIARRLFSAALQPLVRSGEVPCQDREGALNALRTRPVETFDFHHSSAVTAHWAKENFELLGPRLALELSQSTGLPHRETAFWVEAMFRFAATPVDNTARVRTLSGTVFEDPAADLAAYQRLVSLLGLVGTMLRVVLVADELEGFSADEKAALSFASFAGALRQAADRLEIILSVNQDIWESAFLPRLSGGLADRLSEVIVDLEPLDRGTMIALIESRAPGKGEEILNELDGNNLPPYARGLVQQIAEKISNENSLTPHQEQVPVISTEILGEQKWSENPPDSIAQQPTEAPENAPEVGEPRLEPQQVMAPEPEVVEAGFSADAAIAAFSRFREDEPVEGTDGGFLPPAAPSMNEPPQEPSVPLAAPMELTTQPEPPVMQEPLAQPEPPAAFAPAPPPPHDAQEPVAAPVEEQQAPPSYGENPPPEQIPAQQSYYQAPPIPDSSVQAFQVTPPEDAIAQEENSTTDRVDDLLKQFRERYGKS